MTNINLQIALGSFALLTLMLVGAAIGRVFGLSIGDALYLTAVLLVALNWTIHQVTQRRTHSPHDNNEEG